jgi:hypothetical protein
MPGGQIVPKSINEMSIVNYDRQIEDLRPISVVSVGANDILPRI